MEIKDQKPRKPQWYKRAEWFLRRRQILEFQIQNLELEIDYKKLSGPSIIAQLKDVVVSGGQVGSPSEKAVIALETLQTKLIRKRILLAKIENVIKSFSQEEHKLYYLRYSKDWDDRRVWMEMNMSKNPYYDLKRVVILKTALIMNIDIPPDEMPEEWAGCLFDEERIIDEGLAALS